MTKIPMRAALSWLLCMLLGAALQAQPQVRKLQLEASETGVTIAPTMYGIFFEDINFGADGGLYAEMVKNRSFEFILPKTGWQEPRSQRLEFNPESGSSDIIQFKEQGANRNFLRVNVQGPAYALLNEGMRGMGVHAGSTYDLSFLAARGTGSISSVTFALIDSLEQVLASSTVALTSSEWQEYSASMTSTATYAKARLKITFAGKGQVDLDMISLFPRDTWMGRKRGLRKDLVQLLADLQPGFLRFPGGCIVEGRTLDQRYQWKKTVGDIDERATLINRWNTEFGHRPTPDYFQTFGLGFFEYFQLAEDLGATPLPILSCGMACQFNTGELVPLDELDPYVQDALDLIEFANGDPASNPWAKLRRDMGHPEPFNMKYIGVGNEQWGPEYIERYKVFAKAIKAQYPDIVIVSGSGPFPDGDFFDYGMAELEKLDAELVDEHYYRPPQWFRDNATRYDKYDRSGPKIFAGEYAAQSVAIASPDNKNNWDCALSEAAFMTGMERNADVVVMTSYAPLLAHADAWQWTPDLIWFNNLQAYGTANYYVQKMYGNHAGTHLLKVTENGKPVTGADGLYASVVKDVNRGHIYLKVVNTSAAAQQIDVSIASAKPKSAVSTLTLSAGRGDAVNSFGEPMMISPVEGQTQLKGSSLKASVPAHAFVIYTFTQ